MNIKIENGFWGMVRVLVIATLLFLVWGAAPVNASVYEVTTDATPAATMRYICEDSTNLKNGYYAISTAVELQAFAGIVNKTVALTDITVLLNTGSDLSGSPATSLSTTNAKLTGDIDLSSICGAASTVSWIPIGNFTNRYTGTFDGQGYTVKNLYISESDNMQGLFGTVSASTIKNLNVTGAIDANKTGNCIAGIAALIINFTTVENCCSQVVLSNFSAIAGGITCQSLDSIIKNCSNEGVIDGAGEIITGSCEVGGIVGHLYKRTVIDCKNSASIKGNKNVGGIVGHGSQAVYISNSSNSGDVMVINSGVAGGIVGWSGYDGSKISNCFNTGNVEGNENAYTCVGGILGEVDTSFSDECVYVSNCYNTGDLTSKMSGGAIIGCFDGWHPKVIDVHSCYWLDSLTLTVNNRRLRNAKPRIKAGFILA